MPCFYSKSASGIGQAVTIAYAKAGVEGILACDINFDGLDATIEKCKKVASHPNFRVLPLKVDVRVDRDVINMVETAVKEFGRLDYAANVAGIVVTPVATVDQTIEDWDNIHAINVRGVFLCMREEIKAMLKNELRPLIPDRAPTRGSIVKMGSLASVTPVPGMTAYTAAKHAVVGMTKAAGEPCVPSVAILFTLSMMSSAVSHSGDGIRINTVNPGYTLTPQARAFVADFTPYENGTLLKRMGSPEEMADATLFLSSPLSSYMTGSSVYSDGGAMILLK